jgi:hypothetical protein
LPIPVNDRQNFRNEAQLFSSDRGVSATFKANAFVTTT